MRKTTFFLFTATLFLLLLLPVSASSVTVMDDGRLFTAEEVSALENNSFGEGAGVRFFVMTAKDVSSIPSDSRMRDLCGLKEGDSAVILYIRQMMVGEPRYDIYTFGAAYDYFSNSDVDRILDDDDVYDNIKGGHFAAGAKAFLSLTAAHCDEEVASAARHAARKPLYVALISVGVGVVVAGGSAIAIIMVYRRKQHGETYPLDRYAKLNVTDREDRFVGSVVTRTKVQSSSSNDSSSGGGSSGGGHRGGR